MVPGGHAGTIGSREMADISATEGAVRRTALDNGLRLITQEAPHAHSATIGLWVDSGSSSEPTDRAGLSHFIEHLLFKGTPTRSSRDIALAIEQVGGMLNAFTGREFTCFYIKVLHRDVPLAMEILSDIFYNPLFDAQEMEKERTVILQEIKMVDDTPDDLIHDLLHQSLWGETSFGLPILGTSGTVGAISRGQVSEFYGSHYRTHRVVLAAAGKIDSEAVLSLSRKLFSKARSGAGAPQNGMPTPVYRKSIKTFERDLEQVHLCLAYPAFAEKDPRRYALNILNSYLGGGMSSQLFQEVREKRGLVYTIYSFGSLYREVGYVGVYAGVGKDGLAPCLEVTRKELEKVQKGGFDREALARTKTQLHGQLLLGMESTFNQMQKLARDEFLHGRYVPLSEVVSRIEAVTLDDVLGLASELFRPETLSAAFLGPVSSAENLF